MFWLPFASSSEQNVRNLTEAETLKSETSAACCFRNTGRCFCATEIMLIRICNIDEPLFKNSWCQWHHPVRKVWRVFVSNCLHLHGSQTHESHLLLQGIYAWAEKVKMSVYIMSTAPLSPFLENSDESKQTQRNAEGWDMLQKGSNCDTLSHNVHSHNFSSSFWPTWEKQKIVSSVHVDTMINATFSDVTRAARNDHFHYLYIYWFQLTISSSCSQSQKIAKKAHYKSLEVEVMSSKTNDNTDVFKWWFKTEKSGKASLWRQWNQQIFLIRSQLTSCLID